MSSEQNNTLKTQVIIAGAGPTGLSLAAQLIRYNIDFIIIEKNEKTTPLSKAVVVQARTLEIFKELGIAEKAIKEGKVTTALNLFYKGKQRTSVNISGLGNGISEFPYALSLEQSKTEKLLADYIIENKKIIHWQSSFSHLEQNDSSVTAYYKDINGKEQELQADYLVGCDGASSLVRHQIGSSFEGDTVPKLFYVADVRLKSSVINKSELFIFLIKKGFVLFFPMEGSGHYRIVGILPDVKDTDQHFEFAEIGKFIKEQIVSPVEFEELIWFSTYKVHSRKANVFMKGKCFIAGDAAHIHTPAGGQGMNTGIQDAYNLAWKIASCLRDEANPTLLNTYNTERTGNAKHLLQTTDKMFDVMAGVNGFLNFIRLTILPTIAPLVTQSAFAKKRIFPLISQTGIAYPDSQLTITSKIGKVKAGDRMHYFELANGKNSFDYLSDPNFKLLLFGIDSKSQKINTKLKLTMHSFTEIPSTLFGNETNFYILVRPDNHISYIGKDLDYCFELLNKFFGINFKLSE